MSLEKVDELLTRGGSDLEFRAKYNAVVSKEAFVALAAKDGYDFTIEELMQMINENGDTFESYGNPPKRSIWM